MTRARCEAVVDDARRTSGDHDAVAATWRASARGCAGRRMIAMAWSISVFVLSDGVGRTKRCWELWELCKSEASLFLFFGGGHEALASVRVLHPRLKACQ